MQKLHCWTAGPVAPLEPVIGYGGLNASRLAGDGLDLGIESIYWRGSDCAMKTEAVKPVIARLVRAVHSNEGWISPVPVALHGVDRAMAAWKPAPRGRSIWAITAHAAHYLESLVNDLDGKPTDRYAVWPAIGPDDDWNARRDRVIKLSNRLEEQVGALREADLDVAPAGKKTSRALRIVDIMVHDAYHAGQIVTLRQLYRSRAKP